MAVSASPYSDGGTSSGSCALVPVILQKFQRSARLAAPALWASEKRLSVVEPHQDAVPLESGVRFEVNPTAKSKAAGCLATFMLTPEGSFNLALNFARRLGRLVNIFLSFNINVRAV